MGIELSDSKALCAVVESTAPLPMSGFEGVEKRLLVQFSPTANANLRGLRCLTRPQINNLLRLAECTIVSELHNKAFDSYVLSESSLFVYPFKFLLKTCGRTQLLKCIKLLLTYAFDLSLEPCSCKYTHGSFNFPLEQPYPHTSFNDEVEHLDNAFGDAWAHGAREAYSMGRGQQAWHIYWATSCKAMATKHQPPHEECVYTMELCMTQLDRAFAAHFANETGAKSGEDMSRMSGIDKLLPNAELCEFSFAPCGYSMNGMEGSALSTIHITPEEAHSYASFEVMGYNPHTTNFRALINHVLACFRPGKLVISLDVCGSQKGVELLSSWASTLKPFGYTCESSERQELAGNGMVYFHTYCEGTEAPLLDHNKPLFLCRDAKPGKRGFLDTYSEKKPFFSSCGTMDACCYMEAGLMAKLGCEKRARS